MPERLTIILLLTLAMPFALCDDPPDNDVATEDDLDPELRGYPEYETWKPTAHASAPEVILIKQKDPHHHSETMSTIKHHLPLLAVLAPLIAVAVLLPLKAYLGPSYIVYPPVAPPSDAPASKRERLGKVEKEEESLMVQVMNMIEEIDKVYGEMSETDEEES